MNETKNQNTKSALKRVSDWVQRVVSLSLILSLVSCEPILEDLPKCSEGTEHKWGKWEQEEVGGYVTTVTFQSRKCEACGWTNKVKHQQEQNLD